MLGKSTWAVLALTCHIEIFTQVHYKKSIEPDENLSQLWKDVFLRHWQEESQHAILDELEWRREDAKLTDAERDAAVTDLIDARGWRRRHPAGAGTSRRALLHRHRRAAVQRGAASGRLEAGVLKAYRWQYIVSGVQDGRFLGVLAALITQPQLERISAALAPLM